MSELIFVTCEMANIPDGYRLINNKRKQHIYKHHSVKELHTGIVYNGNKSLCGMSSVANEDRMLMSMDELDEFSEFQSDNCCKNCLRIKNKGKS